MSSKPQRDAQAGSSDDSVRRKPMPFEPVKNQKQAEKKAEKKPEKKAERKPEKVAASKSSPRTSSSKAAPVKGSAKGSKSDSPLRTSTAIPDVVSRRMLRRMALFSGIPTVFGMSTFVLSYWVVSHDLIQLPTYAVLLVSLGWFGLGVLGLTYGVLSASWDEETLGSKLGWAEFTTNFGRMTEAWRSQKSQDKQS
jgi:hypothetical protein